MTRPNKSLRFQGKDVNNFKDIRFFIGFTKKAYFSIWKTRPNKSLRFKGKDVNNFKVIRFLEVLLKSLFLFSNVKRALGFIYSSAKEKKSISVSSHFKKI